MNKKVDLFMDDFVKYQIRGGQLNLKPMNNVNYNGPRT
jgi:hypothetical protein